MSTAPSAVQNSSALQTLNQRAGVAISAPRPSYTLKAKASIQQRHYQRQSACQAGSVWTFHAKLGLGARRARHVAHGATQQGVSSAEPGLATALGGSSGTTHAGANAPVAAPLLAGGLGGEQPQTQAPVLVATEALLAASPMGLDLLSAPTALATELRTAGAPVERSGNPDMSAARPAFVSSSAMAPVIAPGGWAGGPADSAAGSVAAAAGADTEVLVVVPPGVSAMAVDLGITGQQQQQQQQLQPQQAEAGQQLQPPSSSSSSSTSPTNGNAGGHPAAAAGAAAAAAMGAAASQQQQQQQHLQQPAGGLWERLKAVFGGIQWGKLWALALLSVSYVHQATTGFALPAMLPMISNELHLTDLQGALLTTGYSYLYAVALVPIGLLADRVSRPKLLAAGLALWSILTCTASTCRSFGDLMLARVGFAAAQGAQNPVCFSLIPELFPVNKSTALSLYNCAIYVGRALSFAAVLLARHLHDNDQAHIAARGGIPAEPVRLDHLDRADLHSLSIMHTAGEMAAATPDREFNFPLWEYGNDLPDAAWRQVLRWIAIPGFLIGLAMMFTLQEPRQAAAAAAAASAPPSSAVVSTKSAPTTAAAAPAAAAVTAPPLTGVAQPAPAVVPAATAAAPSAAPSALKDSSSSSSSGILALLRSPGFMSVTLAAALNDVGSYALIAWQSTFYERVYGLSSAAYAPVLAALLPIGGILGGVGGGYLADRLSRSGKRWWITFGATCLAAPCLAASCLAPTPELSYAALVVGFALSEMWRAPSAVMARGIAPPSMGSSASALYLCVRNLLGGLGPLMVAGLIGPLGLQQAMMVVPAMYLGSGLIFGKAEQLYEAEMAAKTRAEAKAAAA